MREGAPTPPSLFALSEARRVARHAGATVFAVLLCEALPPEILAAVASRLGRAGADKVLLGEAAGFGAPALDATHGPALHAIAERIAPIIVVFPTGGPGPELAAPLAMRLSGVFGGCSDLLLCADESPMPDGTGRVVLRRWRGTHAGCRHLDPVEIERPVVAILGACGAAVESGDGEVEVEIVTCTPPTQSAVTELSSEPDPFAEMELARTLVIVSPDAPPGTLDALAAATTPELAVVDAQKVRPAALAYAAPQMLLFVGAEVAWTFGSPGMHVGAVTAKAQAPAAAVDAIWVTGGDRGADVGKELAAALGAAANAGTGRATP
ncbi:MAG TPA: hypothetical protein VGL59_24135 [Polyangia bacterium]